MDWSDKLVFLFFFSMAELDWAHTSNRLVEKVCSFAQFAWYEFQNLMMNVTSVIFLLIGG